MKNAPGNLALAFTGSLSCALALCFAILGTEPFSAECLIAMTTYCVAEFLKRAREAPDAGV